MLAHIIATATFHAHAAAPHAHHVIKKIIQICMYHHSGPGC